MWGRCTERLDGSGRSGRATAYHLTPPLTRDDSASLLTSSPLHHEVGGSVKVAIDRPSPSCPFGVRTVVFCLIVSPARPGRSWSFFPTLVQLILGRGGLVLKDPVETRDAWHRLCGISRLRAVRHGMTPGFWHQWSRSRSRKTRGAHQASTGHWPPGPQNVRL